MILLQIKVRMMSSWSLVQFQLPILLPDSSADTVKRVLAEYVTKVTKSDNNSSNKRNTVNNNVTEDKDGIRIYLFNPELYLQYSSNLLHFRASKTKQDLRKSSMSRQGSDQPSSSSPRLPPASTLHCPWHKSTTVLTLIPIWWRQARGRSPSQQTGRTSLDPPLLQTTSPERTSARVGEAKPATI